MLRRFFYELRLRVNRTYRKKSNINNYSLWHSGWEGEEKKCGVSHTTGSNVRQYILIIQ